MEKKHNEPFSKQCRRILQKLGKKGMILCLAAILAAGGVGLNRWEALVWASGDSLDTDESLGNAENEDVTDFDNEDTENDGVTDFDEEETDDGEDSDVIYWDGSVESDSSDIPNDEETDDDVAAQLLAEDEPDFDQEQFFIGGGDRSEFEHG